MVSRKYNTYFKQIANFCNLHEVEVQGIADGEVAKGIMAYNPIISGQLTREEIELSSKDETRDYKLKILILKYQVKIKKLKNIYLFLKDKINQILHYG